MLFEVTNETDNFLNSRLQVLEGVIKYRWNALPVEQRDGMKNYISEVIVKVSKSSPFKNDFAVVSPGQLIQLQFQLDFICIENFILLFFQLSSDEISFRRERLYVNKLNVILVQVISSSPHNVASAYLLLLFCGHLLVQDTSHSHCDYIDYDNVLHIQILKHEWPARWRSFIPDLVAAAKTSETICENCMAILKVSSLTFIFSFKIYLRLVNY